MREIVLFVEDFAHRQVIGALVRLLAGYRASAVENPPPRRHGVGAERA